MAGSGGGQHTSHKNGIVLAAVPRGWRRMSRRCCYLPCRALKISLHFPSHQKESQKADEYLREIKDQKLLSEAVRQCIEAASYEHQPEIQKSLLRVRSLLLMLQQGTMMQSTMVDVERGGWSSSSPIST